MQVAVNAATQASSIRRQTPYGGGRGANPGWPNDRGFVGGVTDNTGLTHLGAREYDPAIGRFLSVDPVMDEGDPQQWQAYSYANNTPITMSDPDGLAPCEPGEDCSGYKPGCERCNIDEKAKNPCWPAKSCDPPKKPADNHKGGDDSKEKPPPEKKKEEEEPTFLTGAESVAKVLDWASAILGLLPAFICGPCAVISMIAGTLAGVLYLIAGKIGEAIKAFGGALLGMVLGEAGKLLSSKILLKKFGGQFFEVAYSMRNKVHHYRFVPSGIRAKIDAAVDTITAGLGALYNGLVPTG